MITNKLAGLDMAIFDFQNMILPSKVNKKAAVRTADDGIHLVSTFMEEKHCGTVSHMMSNQKSPSNKMRLMI
jgi:hypothetical protein